MKKIILLSCIMILLPFGSAFAATINVPSDQPTIQAGIDAASDGDEVVLADGTYTGVGNYNVDLNGKSITVKSSGGAENCIVDCEGMGRGFLVYSGETVTFVGLTVKSGDAGDGDDGGGIYANASEIIVIDCVFDDNIASGNGGAVYSYSSPSSFTNCTFTFNTANDGGAVHSLDSLFINCTFISNSAFSRGGAVTSSYFATFYSTSYTTSFNNCTFTSNIAGSDGGAVYGGVSAIGCTFFFNKASRGGAIYARSSLKDCIFTSNSASDGGAVYYGSCFGPLQSSCAAALATNCIFTSNSASTNGGAINAERGYDLTNCTFISNRADSSGGAIGAANLATNCTFTDNVAGLNGGAANSVNSLIKCTFTSNIAGSDGGAVHIVSSSSNCTFTSNSASSNGGAVWYYSSLFTNCIFNSNYACNGGGIYAYSANNSSINNCTFTLNETSECGGAFWCDITLAPENPIILRNCILWGNAAPEGPEIYENQKPLTIIYSNIQGGHTGEGNIDSDPLFIDADNNDLHLQYSSHCVDTGTTDGAPPNDLDCNYRPVGSGYDMGAYEYQGPIIVDSFTANPTTGKPSLIVDFTCTAHDDSNTITEYQWNFGDGNSDSTSTGTTQHTYIVPGTFSATCTVFNDNSDQTTVSTTVEVTNDIPIADAGQDQIIPGSSVELDGSGSSDPDGTISSWQWTLSHTENSAYDKTASGEIVYLSDLEYGHYTVTLTVTDNFGAQCTDEMFLSIAGSTGNVYSQEDLDRARQGGHDHGYLEGMDEGLNNSGNTIAGVIEEGANGEKVIEGPVIIKGTLVIE